VDYTTLPAKLQSVPGRPHVNANLLLCRWMVEQAFRSACRVDQNGMPSEIALEAVEWIEAHLDWHSQGEIPPESLREEYYLSFEWCCQWLDLNPDVVRQQGLPLGVASVPGHGKRWHTRYRDDRGRNSRIHIHGLPDVHARWQAAAQQHAQRPGSAVEHEQVLCVL
jgi:hypothetical protein